jgi:hypothetical protein
LDEALFFAKVVRRSLPLRPVVQRIERGFPKAKPTVLHKFARLISEQHYGVGERVVTIFVLSAVIRKPLIFGARVTQRVTQIVFRLPICVDPGTKSATVRKMPWTPDAALDDPVVERPMVFVSEFRFYLKDIPTEITVRLYRPLQGRAIVFEQSHFIKTPTQAGPYRTDKSWNDDEGSALHQVVFGFTSHYNEAVNRGHRPDPSWLEENEQF